MSKVLAIAVIAIRNAVRSRMVILLLGILLIAIIGIPLTIKGDGTVSGLVQVLLRYTIGFASFLLSLATVWAGCAAVSLEIQDRSLQLVVTKPVRRWQIWLGKWLGLVLLNGVLLVFCAGITYGLLRWTTRPVLLTPAERTTLRDEILTARRRVEPRPVPVEEEVLLRFNDMKSRGELPRDVPESEFLAALRESALRAAFSVPPAGQLAWRFPLAVQDADDESLLFRYSLASSDVLFDRVNGVWRIGRAGGAPPVEQQVRTVPRGSNTLRIPAADARGTGDLVVTYSNVNEEPVTVLFDPRDGLQLFAYAGRFETNFTRAFLALFIELAFLAALGVTMGSLFSMPVASFAAFCFILLIQVSGYIHSMAREEIIFWQPGSAAPTLWDAFFRRLFTLLDWVTTPLQGANPLDLLADGQLITPDLLGRLLVMRVVVYAGVLALLSGWILNRREIALPSTS